MLRRLVCVVVLLVGFGTTSPAVAQEQEGARAADHAALRVLRDEMARALQARDAEKLATLLAREFVVTTVDQTAITKVSEIKPYLQRMFVGPQALLTGIEVNPEALVLTRFVSDTAGYCYGTSVDTYHLKSGGVTKMTTRWTALLVKEEGAWKVAAIHFGTNFLDNPVLDRSIAAGRNLAIGGLAVGLLVGGLGVWMLKRRSGSSRA
jgi:ketosteroid isomerase-like protein